MTLSNRLCVYIHEMPDGKRYVGMTRLEPETRFRNGKGYASNKAFYSEIERVGWENIKHTIVAEDLTVDDAKALEIELIDKYNTTSPEFGFNKKRCGGYETQESIESNRNYKCFIRLYRKKAGINQNQLSELLGVRTSTVSMWESCDRHPSFRMIKAMSRIFGITTDELLRGPERGDNNV